MVAFQLFFNPPNAKQKQKKSIATKTKKGITKWKIWQNITKECHTKKETAMILKITVTQNDKVKNK